MTDQTPPIDNARPPRPPTHRHEALPRVIGALGLLWLCLFAVFGANSRSESYVRLEPMGPGPFDEDPTALSVIETRVVLLWPISMRLWHTSSRQAVSNVADYLGYTLDADALELLGTETIDVDYRGEPLYRVLHDLLGDPHLGFALAGRRLQIFEQDARRTITAEQEELHWEAVLDLTDRRALIVPTADSMLWFSVRLRPSVNAPRGRGTGVQIELWQENEKLAVAQTTLDELGQARVTLDQHDNVVFTIQQLSQAGEDAQGPVRFQLSLYHQAFMNP